jgi:histidyl-tRNA synthetase
MADIEVISLGYEFLKKLDIIGKITLKINSLGDTDSRVNYRKVLIEYLNDYRSKLSEDSIKRLSENPLRILDSKNAVDQKILIDAPNVLDYLNEKSRERFENVCEGLNVLKIKYEIDKNLVRGLDYYCHTAFEFMTDELGAQGTVLAGGRYDGLSKMLGGVEVPGVGWAAGVERLALMVQSEYINSPDIVLMAQTELYNHLLLPIMNELINQGFKVEIIYTGNMSKKFKRANKINASFAILLGEEEVAKKVIKLKNLLLGSEQLIDLDQGIKIIKKTLKN